MVKRRHQLKREAKVIEFKTPKNVSELRSFLGTVGWLRGVISNYAVKVRKMTECLYKSTKWDWNVEIQVGYFKIKDEASELKNFSLPNY